MPVHPPSLASRVKQIRSADQGPSLRKAENVIDPLKLRPRRIFSFFDRPTCIIARPIMAPTSSNLGRWPSPCPLVPPPPPPPSHCKLACGAGLKLAPPSCDSNRPAQGVGRRRPSGHMLGSAGLHAPQAGDWHGNCADTHMPRYQCGGPSCGRTALLCHGHSHREAHDPQETATCECIGQLFSQQSPTNTNSSPC